MRPFQVGTSQKYPSIPLYITVNEPSKGHEQDLILDIVTLVRQHAAFPEGARHIDLLTEVVHRRLEQFELIHVELLLLLACSLGSHAPARRIAVTVFFLTVKF
jgi:hypothetical protein